MDSARLNNCDGYKTATNEVVHIAVAVAEKNICKESDVAVALLRNFFVYLELKTFKATFYSSSQLIIFVNDE